MNSATARAQARALRREGLDYATISEKLYQGGYRSKRGGGAPAKSTISAWVKTRCGQPAVAESVRTSPKPSRSVSAKLAAVEKILAVSEMSAADRIALIQLMLG